MRGAKNFDRNTLEQALAELELQEIFSTLDSGPGKNDSSKP